MELRELYLNGRMFTWSNERQNPTLEKIDHVFALSYWEDLHPVYLLIALGSAVSAHCPLLLNLNANFFMVKRFRFEAFWPKADGFHDIFTTAWQSVPSSGNAFVALDNDLWATSKALQRWSDRWIKNVKLQNLIALEVITRLDEAMDSQVLSVGANKPRLATGIRALQCCVEGAHACARQEA
ncbi:Disease resistance protein RPM1 [Hordeum vulgare]|nr:Disease resistance protein RPM1 [Hordeum vulgare]